MWSICLWVSLVLNPAQKHFSQERTGQDIILKSGKVGFTTFIGILGLLRCITRLNHTALLIAHEDKPAQDFFNQVSFALQNLPGGLGQELRSGALKTTQAHVREIVFPVLGSRYFVETAGDSKAAVGQNYQFLHATEVSRWKGNVKQTFSTLNSHQIGNFQESYVESRPFGDTGYFHDE